MVNDASVWAASTVNTFLFSQWRQHFPWVHQIFGVDRLLDGEHQGKRPSPMLRFHIFLLPHSNAMLACDRPAHG